MGSETEQVKFRVLELYAGIGGMHTSLKASGVSFEVVQAMEINPLVLSTYTHNFPRTAAVPRNIESITAEELNKLNINVIVMSPPCQPFCRTGRKLDIEDTRSSSLAHLLNILPEINFEYLLVENVKGFDESDARDTLIETVKKCKMHWQEFLLTPTVVGVPNSRLRYYLLAKKVELKWCFELSETILTSVPLWGSSDSPYVQIVADHRETWSEYRSNAVKLGNVKDQLDGDEWCVGDVLESGDLISFSIPTKLISKYGSAMDIVTKESVSTNCFTKGYGNYVKGTGSYLAQEKSDEDTVLVKLDDNITEKLMSMKLRYFTPREAARLMCYPDEFTFPPKLSTKQKYRALGNSINVYVVSILLSLLLSDS